MSVLGGGDVFLQRALCAQGLGLALLPCFMSPPDVERRSQPQHRANVWVLVHPDQRGNRRIGLFRDAMARAPREHPGPGQTAEA